MSGKIEVSKNSLGEVCAVASYIQQVFTETIAQSLSGLADINPLAESGGYVIDDIWEGAVEVDHDKHHFWVLYLKWWA